MQVAAAAARAHERVSALNSSLLAHVRGIEARLGVQEECCRNISVIAAGQSHLLSANLERVNHVNNSVLLLTSHLSYVQQRVAATQNNVSGLLSTRQSLAALNRSVLDLTAALDASDRRLAGVRYNVSVLQSAVSTAASGSGSVRDLVWRNQYCGIPSCPGGCTQGQGFCTAVCLSGEVALSGGCEGHWADINLQGPAPCSNGYMFPLFNHHPRSDKTSWTCRANCFTNPSWPGLTTWVLCAKV